MRVNDARAAFDAFTSAAGVDVGHLTAEEAVELMLTWYRDERAEDVDLSDGGDMLLYQWGTYDWGDGPSFQFDIARQLIPIAAVDDNDIWQLSVTLHFEPSTEARAVGQGDRWCPHPDDADEVRRFVLGSDSVALVRGRRADRVEVTYDIAG